LKECFVASSVNGVLQAMHKYPGHAGLLIIMIVLFIIPIFNLLYF